MTKYHVKIIKQYEDLEAEINNWLKDNAIKIISISYAVSPEVITQYTEYHEAEISTHFHPSALITYTDITFDD